MREVLFKERLPGLMVEHVICRDEYSMDVRHTHSEYEIYYLVDGERYYLIENETIKVKSKNILFINKEKIHKTSAVPGKNNFNRILLQLREEWVKPFFMGVRGVSAEDFFGNYRLLELDEHGKEQVEELLATIAIEASRRELGYEQMIRARLAELFLFVMRTSNMTSSEEYSMEGNASSSRHAKANEVAKYIQNHCSEPISLQDLSERFFMSKCYLSRIFKEVTSYTVGEYVTAQRIRQGRKLLETTDYSITQVSEMAGFESVTYFERVFKKHLGLTPFQYRKTRKEVWGGEKRT